MGWDLYLKQIKENNTIQETKDKREDEHPTIECPFCAWSLETNESGIVTCPMCERIWR